MVDVEASTLFKVFLSPLVMAFLLVIGGIVVLLLDDAELTMQLLIIALLIGAVDFTALIVFVIADSI